MCSDTDNDSCDDCVNGSFDVANDGVDTDGDGIRDVGDLCVNVADPAQLTQTVTISVMSVTVVFATSPAMKTVTATA